MKLLGEFRENISKGKHRVGVAVSFKIKLVWDELLLFMQIKGALC